MTIRFDQTGTERRQAELRARRAMARAASMRRPRRTVRVPRQNFPRGVRLEYQRSILKLVREVAEKIRDEILPNVRRLVDQTRQTDPSVRQDAPADEAAEALEDLSGTVLETSRRGITAAATASVRGVSGFNQRELDRVFERTLGVGIPASEPYLDDFIIAATRENVRRVTALLESEFVEAENVILSGFRRGLRFEEIARTLDERFSIVENRARLIARDQVASLNGELNRLRQTNLGVESYIWRTSQDDRVREEHEALEGERFTWAQGSPEGHPGEPINCRCIAEPVLGDLIEATDPTFI
jgi:SPP1 gp7 family putative phage head morphogenesis protein